MTIVSNTFDETTLRRAFAHFPSGVAAIAVHVENAEHVLVVSSFCVGVSLVPPLVSFSVQCQSTTWPILREAGRLGVSVLSAGQGTLCRQLSHKDKDKRWVDVDVEHTPSGAVFIGEAALTFECSIYAVHPAGDHEIVLLQVEALRAATELDPLVYHGSQFRALEIVL